MSLSVNTRLGPYEVLLRLGAGGMGEVFRARDTRLGRDVAIKVLSRHLTEMPDARQRFEREARAVSSLNHPHICTLYDIGHQDGVDFLVMEYLEGQTLAQRLESGPLGTEDLLRIGIEISGALENAHRNGILHRDLKPSNIMLTKSGAKLMDFGLAKAAAGGPAPAALESLTQPLDAPARSTPVTRQGTIVGTFPYISPERLEGRDADARSDIFSLGAVLYEMATGKRAFEGKTAASVMAAILEREPPPISSLQPMSPPALDRTVKICLAKDPDERFQSAHDVKLQLEWIRDAGSQAGVPAPFMAHRKHRERIAWAAAAAALIAAATGGVWVRDLQREIAHKALPLQASLLPDAGFSYPGLDRLALSPDGRRLAWIALDAKGQTTLRVRDLGSPAARDFPGTEGARDPFWSPDGRYIAFFAHRKLEKVDALGGPPQFVADIENDRGGAWGAGGVIVFAPAVSGSLYRVSAEGGRVSEVAKLAHGIPGSGGFNSYRYPSFLPDARHFLFLARGDPDMVRVGSVDGGEPKSLVPGSNAAYADGYLVFAREDTLMAQRFDPDRLQLRDNPVVLARGVAVDRLNHYSPFAVAGDTLVYETGSASGFAMRIFSRAGTEVTSSLPGSPDEVPFQVRFSPDGKRIAATIFKPNADASDLWIYDPARNLRTRFTFHPSGESSVPVWSPDGSRILYSSNQRGHSDLQIKPADLAQPEQPLLQDTTDKIADDWSPDGKFVIYSAANALWTLPLAGDHKPTLFLTPANGSAGRARFSPDGRWVAYQSDASGAMQVYITSFPDHRGVWQVSAEGGANPAWGAGGRELFFLAANGVYAATISSQLREPVVGAPKVLFSVPDAASLTTSMFDVSRDGEKFLLVCNVESGNPGTLTIFSNWVTTLHAAAH